MKIIFPILMGILVLAGILYSSTPFIASKFFPETQSVTQEAEPTQVAAALKQWFAAPEGTLFEDTYAMNYATPSQRISWIAFKTDRDTISHYIIKHHLEQRELDENTLNTIFRMITPKPWWNPKSLNRETWFSGISDNRQVSLLYNPQNQQVYMVTKTKAELMK